MGSTYRRDTQRLRAAAGALLDAPDTDHWPSTSAIPDPDPLQALQALATRGLVPNGPKFTTESDSRLYVYRGAVLGLRQLLLQYSGATKDPLPPWFNDTPPKLLALVAPQLGALGLDFFTMDEWVPRLTDEDHTIIDCWEGLLFHLALPAYVLSHLYLPSVHRWVPLTPTLETRTQTAILPHPAVPTVSHRRVSVLSVQT